MEYEGRGGVLKFVPGMAAALAVAFAARWIPYHGFGLGAMIWAIGLGMAVGFLWGDVLPLKPGVDVVGKYWLRAGIIFMGARLHWGQVAAAGPQILVLDAVNMGLVLILLLFVWPFGGLSRRTQILTGIGSAICGASAIAAVSPILMADEEETGLALALVTALGMAGTLVLAWVYRTFMLTDAAFGILTGSLLQETGHVVAAAGLAGPAAMETALLAKLVRVAMLVPVSFVLSRIFSKGKGALAVPWFVLGFAGFSVLRTMDVVTPQFTGYLTAFSGWLLTAAMAAIGIKMQPKQLRSLRWRHLGQGILLFSAVLAVSSLILHYLGSPF